MSLHHIWTDPSAQCPCRLGEECQPESFTSPTPSEALFDPKKIVIISNGRCASSCALFSVRMSYFFARATFLDGYIQVTMAKEEGVKTVVYGGRKGVQQQYSGTVGGQSTDFSIIDTEIKVRPMSPKHRFEICSRLPFLDDTAQERSSRTT